MLINYGTQERVIAEAPSAAGVTQVEGSIRSDSILVSLWVESVDSGALTVTVYTLTDEGKEVAVINFPAITSTTTEILLRKSAVSLQRFRVAASYTGGCSYEVYVRAVAGGESSARILGSADWKVTQATIGTSATELIPASLNDRQGIVIKNWSNAQTVYVAETLAKATSLVGYPLAPRDALALDIAAGASVYAVSDAPAADLRIAESGG